MTAMEDRKVYLDKHSTRLQLVEHMYPLVDVDKPNVFRNLFHYDEIPKIAFNDRIVPHSMPDEIWITDTTFRDGQQSRTPYTTDQIVTLYDYFHRLGGPNGKIRQCEFFLYSKKDRDAVYKCMERGYKFPEITSWIRASKKDFELVKEIGMKETGILVSCSDYHIFYKLKMTRREAMNHYLSVVRECLDTGISALGKTCDSLGLTGLPEKAAIMCNDKSKMKKAFMEYGVSTAQYFEISNEEELENALNKIKLPVIIKATDLQGSNGIYIAKTEKDAYDGFHAAMGLTKRSYCIVEEFIEGWEFGAQAFVYNNEVLFVMPHGDETYMSHTAVPVGHYVPLDCDEDVYKQTEIAVKSAIKALGLNNCAVNVDLILRDNKVYVIELTGRVGANCLPELVEINFGIEYYKMIAAMAVGENPLEYWRKKNSKTTAGLARMILSTEESGTLEDIKYTGEMDEDILEITFFKKPGDQIRKFVFSADCIGQIIVKDSTLDECRAKINKIMSNIEIKLK